MHFDGSLALRLASLAVDVAAGAYTRRNIDLGTLVRKAHECGDLDVAAAHASSFTFKPKWDDDTSDLEVVNGFCSGAAVGMGCALISRTALLQMVEYEVVKPRLDLNAGPGRTCWSFFEPMEVDGFRLGEDYSFCYRWTKLMNRQLWVCIDEAIGHLGGFEYRARYLDLLTD
jgi:hypothetical protein